MPNVSLPQTKTWHKFKSCKLRHIATTAVLLCLSQQTFAADEQDWWFDVEIIVFKRETSVTELSEKFVNSEIKAKKTKVVDLLAAYLQPDLTYLRADLPFCRLSELTKKQQQYEEDFAFPEPVQSELNNESSDEPIEAVSARSKPVQQEDFQYQVVSNDIFAQQAQDTKQLTVEQDDVVQDSPIEFTQDLSVDWIEWQMPQQLPCVYREQLELLTNPFTSNNTTPNPLAKLDRVPVSINGLALERKSQAFILPKSELTLGSLSKGINKQRDLEVMLHMGWRQDVKFGQDKAKSIRLFAGKNYGQTFLSDGSKRPLPESKPHLPYIPLAEQDELSAYDTAVMQDQVALQQNQQLFNAVFNALHNDEPLKLNQAIEYGKNTLNTKNNSVEQDLPFEEIWQLDGNIKVYLQNVGRTPYLHIESNVDFRQPVFDPSLVMSTDTNDATVMTGNLSREPNIIQSVNVNHFKRVISKQLHYFDHPLFGMVVHITRYNWPAEDPVTEQ